MKGEVEMFAAKGSDKVTPEERDRWSLCCQGLDSVDMGVFIIKVLRKKLRVGGYWRKELKRIRVKMWGVQRLRDEVILTEGRSRAPRTYGWALDYVRERGLGDLELEGEEELPAEPEVSYEEAMRERKERAQERVRQAELEAEAARRRVNAWREVMTRNAVLRAELREKLEKGGPKKGELVTEEEDASEEWEEDEDEADEVTGEQAPPIKRDRIYLQPTVEVEEIWHGAEVISGMERSKFFLTGKNQALIPETGRLETPQGRFMLWGRIRGGVRRRKKPQKQEEREEAHSGGQEDCVQHP
jgi:hypothetical protein